jgi:hypothetical protein
VSVGDSARSRDACEYIHGVEALERARQVAAEWDERLRADLPAGVDIFDAHTHLGNDVDGMTGRYEELEGVMDRYGISRAFVFCLDEPDRHPGFRAGNDRTLEFAERSQLILAHAGIADLANLADRFSGKRGVFFDTSVWSAVDLLGLLRLVPPEQVVYASDYPYGQQPGSLLLSLRVARVAGFDDEQLRGMLAGNANRIVAGEDLAEPTRPRVRGVLEQPLAQARIHQYLSMAMPLLFVRQPDAFGALGLALNATEEPNGSHREELERIRELLLAARDLWRTLPEAEDDTEVRTIARTAVRLIQMADTLAVTSG